MWGKDSLSGKGRNRLFLSEQGKQFKDVSLLSGAAHLGDGRSVVLFDYDRDGYGAKVTLKGGLQHFCGRTSMWRRIQRAE
jgi:uncharacterized protein YdiU (UPF0061 family)